MGAPVHVPGMVGMVCQMQQQRRPAGILVNRQNDLGDRRIHATYARVFIVLADQQGASHGTCIVTASSLAVRRLHSTCLPVSSSPRVLLSVLLSSSSSAFFWLSARV